MPSTVYFFSGVQVVEGNLATRDLSNGASTDTNSVLDTMTRSNKLHYHHRRVKLGPRTLGRYKLRQAQAHTHATDKDPPQLQSL
jgi:hypothetical protein